jgi:hypothetical protein
MANRIPLVVDTSDGNKIKELPINDNLDLTNSNLVGVNAISTQSITINSQPFTLQYSELQNTPTIPSDISELTDTQSLLGQGGGGGNVIIQGGGGLIITADDSVARTILPGNTLKIQGAGDVTTTLTEENGTDVLTITHNVAGSGPDTNTTYVISAEDGDDANSKKIRLRDSSDAIQDITLIAGTNVGITRNANSFTFTSTDNNTTYGIASATDGSGNQVLRLQSSSGATDDVKIIPGSGISVTRTDENSITINNTQTLPNVFSTIRVGLTNVVADSTSDTLTLVAGAGIVITPNAGNDTIQIDSSIQNQNLFQTVGSDSGSVTASSITDTLNIVGGSAISTNISGNTLEINYTGNVGGEANNFEIVAIGTPVSNVELIADDPNDTLYFTGGSGISITATGTGLGPGGAVDQVFITNSAPNVDQNIFYNVTGDTGTITASSITDTLPIKGGTDITTSVVNGELKINYVGSNSNFNLPDNYAYKTFAITPSGGSTTASSNVDTLNFSAGTGVTLSASNDLITITNSAPNVDQNIFQNVLAGGVTIVADTPTDTLSFAAGTGISITGDAVGDQITITNSAPNVDQNLFGSIAVSGQTSITPNSTNTALTFINGGGLTFTTNNVGKSVTVTNSSPNVDQNIFNTVRVSGQTDVTTASTNGVLTFVAGTGVTLTTDNSAKSVTINSAGATQNLFETFSADSGTITASGATDTFTIAGDPLSGIQTAIVGGVLTISSSSPGAPDQNLFETVNTDSGSVTAGGVVDELYILGGTGISTSTNVSGHVIITASGGGSGTPGGADTQVQFNDGGAFAGDTTFTFNKSTDTLFVKNIEAETVQAPSTLVGTYTISSPTTITLDPVDEIINDAPMKLVSKTVTQLSTLVSSVGAMVFCTNESGGAIPAFYDGTNWRRVSDRAIVS